MRNGAATGRYRGSHPASTLRNKKSGLEPRRIRARSRGASDHVIRVLTRLLNIASRIAALAFDQNARRAVAAGIQNVRRATPTDK